MSITLQPFLRRMLRKLLIVSMTFSLAWTAAACTAPFDATADRSQPTQTQPAPQAAPQNNLSDGDYPVQQATYDDSIGEYSVMLLNTRAGESSIYRSTNLPLARLTDEQIKAGQKSFLKVENGEPALYLSEDFRIEYVHNVTETQQNPQTGQPEVVVVRQESSFWTPFAGALAGQALGSLLFRPTYYFPPVYQPGLPLVGYGGYGNSYGAAINQYQRRYQAPPIEVRNRQALRTTGQLRTPSVNSPVRTSNRTANRSSGGGFSSSNLRRANRSTGSGYGNSNLQRSNRTSPSYQRPNPSFGSKRSPSGFGSGRSLGGRRSGGRRR
ncbi:hypothetical protein [Leptolyngbya ohadii]|uniref:hypothetical protein n=1 Tax=Leptolyngbya ohadii TaxID=1962290 RepID=UPI0019D42352|nr:hypothetical protein [Leptolyngbya ohadii]